VILSIFIKDQIGINHLNCM